MENQIKSPPKDAITQFTEKLCAWIVVAGIVFSLRFQSVEIALWFLLGAVALYELVPQMLRLWGERRELNVSVGVAPIFNGPDDSIPPTAPPNWRSLPEHRKKWLRDRYAHSFEREEQPFEEWADDHVQACPIDEGWALELIETIYEPPAGNQL